MQVHGLRALGLLDDNPEDIDFLLPDVIMPHMNGRELAERTSAPRPAAILLRADRKVSIDG
ncbi:MAG: hypothetical protein ABI664_07005 [bacterium]